MRLQPTPEVERTVWEQAVIDRAVEWLHAHHDDGPDALGLAEDRLARAVAKILPVERENEKTRPTGEDEVERLQKRVDELESELADAERVINNTRLMAAERMTQVMAEMAHLRVQVKELSDPIVRAKMMEPPGPTIVQALSPTTTGYVGDGEPIQKADAFGVVEDETL